MEEIKISQLPISTVVEDDAVIPVVQNGRNEQMLVSDLLEKNTTAVRVTALENLVSKSYLISNAEGNGNGASLMDWCNANPKPGIQLVQLGEGAISAGAPAEFCLAFYCCNMDMNRRTIWVIANNGTLYTRTYINGEWKSWYSYVGTAFTV